MAIVFWPLQSLGYVESWNSVVFKCFPRGVIGELFPVRFTNSTISYGWRSDNWKCQALPEVEAKAIAGILTLIERERMGVDVNRPLLRSLLRMLSALQVRLCSVQGLWSMAWSFLMKQTRGPLRLHGLLHSNIRDVLGSLSPVYKFSWGNWAIVVMDRLVYCWMIMIMVGDRVRYVWSWRCRGFEVSGYSRVAEPVCIPRNGHHALGLITCLAIGRSTKSCSKADFSRRRRSSMRRKAFVIWRPRMCRTSCST